MVCLLLILAAAVYILFFRIRDVALEQKYDKTSSVFGVGNLTMENGRADSFASDLCVSSTDVSMEGLDLLAGSAALFDESEQQVIYAKGLYEKRYPASLTKIMTTLVALKYGNLDDVVTVGEECEDIEYGSSVCEIKVGDRFTLKQLLYGLMINSGNDAAMTIAVHVGGTVEHFVELMNQEAEALGCTGTHFMNPHGLQDEDHYTTVYDIYLMFHEALKYEEFQDIINRHIYYAEYTDGNGEAAGITWESTNHYFSNEAVAPSDVNIVGGKTGTTDAAGACLCLYSKNKYGDPFVSIIMKEDSKDLLYEEMNDLLSKINN
jgi:D-alanyl-D-alanine carboxypeptidase